MKMTMRYWHCVIFLWICVILSINAKIWTPKIHGTPSSVIRMLKIRAGAISRNGESGKTVIVSTSIGTSFLDKKKKFVLGNDATIKDLKLLIHKKFPGLPPVELQDLYFGGELLENSQLCSNITSLPTIPIILDMITGTAGYNRTLSVHEAIEAYAASVVHLTYIGDKMKSTVTPSEPTASLTPKSMQTLYYRQLFEIVNASLYEKYAVEIAQALEDEKDPEYYITDKYLWRQPTQKSINPLTAAVAKEFDLNWNGLQNFVYFSLIILVFAVFGTQSVSSYYLLLSAIPVMWISKLRQLRLLYKIVLYLFLPLAAHFDFLLPLLPAPLQVIALRHEEWFPDANSNSDNDSSRHGDVEDEDFEESEDNVEEAAEEEEDDVIGDIEDNEDEEAEEDNDE